MWKKDGVETRLFFPKSEAKVKEELHLIVLHKRPKNESRPTLHFLQEACTDFLGEVCLSTVYNTLQRFGITYQKGRPYIHSPDEQYAEKTKFLRHVISLAKDPRTVLLFQDEFTLTNVVGSAAEFAPKGQQPLERWAYEEQSQRIAGALNPLSGQVTTYRCNKMTIDHFIRFLQKVTEEYGQADKIYMPLDGWPIHFHPSVQAALVPQEQPFEPNLPPSWENVKPKAKYQDLNLPIQMVSLPTYASWLNPIEKLWKLLKKEITHLFPFPNDFNELLRRTDLFFKEFESPSQRLLQFCGLLKVNGVFYDSLLEAKAPFLKPQIIF